MRSHLTKAIAVLLLVAFFGIPWGLYNEHLAEEARTMSHEQWLAKMDYSQSATVEAAGLTGTLLGTLIVFTGLMCIYEFTKLVAGMIVDRVMGPEDGGGL